MTGDEFKTARRELGWTQGEVADLMGCAIRSVRRWELDQVRVPRSVETIIHLTKRNWALRKSIDSLLAELSRSAPETLDTQAAGQVFRALLGKD